MMIDGDVDPTAVITNTIAMNREQERAHKHRAETRKFRQIVSKSSIPSHSSTVSRALRTFVCFLMGMPDDKLAFPKPPTELEVDLWSSMSDMRFDQLKNHLLAFKEKHAKDAKGTQRYLLEQEERRIRKVINPPPFTAARDATCKSTEIPVSIKKLCEQKLQQAGFSRVTFHWDATPFESSLWNKAIAVIIAECFTMWAQGVPGMSNCGLDTAIQMLGRWVSGQARAIKKAPGSAEELRKTKEEQAKKAQHFRMRKQVRQE